MSALPATLTNETYGDVSAHRDLTRRATPATGVLIALIRGYQLARSGRPTGCRYLPTCSTYAQEAIERFGARRGGWMAVRRLARCHPWGSHGVDPVPERRA